MLSLNKEEVEEIELDGFNSDKQTTYCANVSHKQIIQVYIFYYPSVMNLYLSFHYSLKIHCFILSWKELTLVLCYICFKLLSEYSHLLYSPKEADTKVISLNWFFGTGDRGIGKTYPMLIKNTSQVS